MKKRATLEEAWLGRMRAGKKYFDGGQSDKAANAFRKAEKLCPQRVESWINLGSALLESGRYDQALVAIEKALSLEPKLMLPHLILGDALRETGRWPEALASYRKAVSIQRSPLALNKLACALRVEKRLFEAEALYLEATNLDTNFTLARVNIPRFRLN